MRTFIAISLLVAAVAVIDSSPAAADELPVVVVTVGDSGAVLAGHPGGVGCVEGSLYGCDSRIPNPTYVPPNIDPDLFEHGYHPDGFIVAELAERGVDAIVWPRAVFGSRSSAWAVPDEPVCSPDPPGEEEPYCGKSPLEIAVEIWWLTAVGFQVVIWDSGGVGPLADVFDGTDDPVGWYDQEEWDGRFAKEAADLRTAIDWLRILAPDTPVILPGYANLNSAMPGPVGFACGWMAAGPFIANPFLSAQWDPSYNPLLNGGGGPVYGWFNAYLGTGHPTGIAGVLSGIADADPTIAFGDAGLALRDDGATEPAWLPSPASKLQRDCIHLKASGEEDLVSHVLDTVAPQIPGI